jgi:hypothetical protein
LVFEHSSCPDRFVNFQQGTPCEFLKIGCGTKQFKSDFFSHRFQRLNKVVLGYVGKCAPWNSDVLDRRGDLVL